MPSMCLSWCSGCPAWCPALQPVPLEKGCSTAKSLPWLQGFQLTFRLKEYYIFPPSAPILSY